MTRRILAIDTTAEFGSLALLDGEDVLEEMPLHSSDGFAHVLFPQIDSLLQRNGWFLNGVDCFAAAAGPGAFTGIRVGLTVVKGLAETLHKPAVAVSNLRAIASFGQRDLRAVFLDARRGEVYGAVYSAGGAIVQGEVVTKLGEWLGTLPEGDVELLSPHASIFAPALGERRITPVPRAIAGAIGRIAALQLALGQAQDPAALDANYVRRSDAELFWKDAV